MILKKITGKVIGSWHGEESSLARDMNGIKKCLRSIRLPLMVVEVERGLLACSNFAERLVLEGTEQSSGNGLPLLSFIPAINPENLGDPTFCSDYGIRFPLICGSMAHGISSPALARALGESGMMGFIGSAGLSPERVGELISEMRSLGTHLSYGFNLIHSPQEPVLEERLADLFIANELHLVEASAFLNITPALVRFRTHGIHRDSSGEIVATNRILAKASRIEVARKFFSPPPESIVADLVKKGILTQDQAAMARRIPMAGDLTAEADSGGHTDNRPAISLLPTMIALRDRIQKEFEYREALRVGAAGGIATPASAAAAFSMGAAYIVAGSIFQSCVQSGTSPAAREMLAKAEQADVAMAPAGDMFEMGANVQVLKRGTMFAMRAAKLYENYRSYPGIEEIPHQERMNLEKTIFQDSVQNIWLQTCEFFKRRDPVQIERANREPKHKMALIFRWYLGKSPYWAVTGDIGRKVDYQIWCGPAMGAFNEWVKGSFLESAENRDAVDVAMNILYGASLQTRIAIMKAQGIYPCSDLQSIAPLNNDELREHMTARR